MIYSDEVCSWRKTLVSCYGTIQEALRSLENSSKQIVLAVSDENKLVGTLTDGDIRRALLRGFRLDSGIEKIIQRNPIVVPPEISRESVLQFMQANKILQLPVVDQDGSVIGLYIWDSVLGPAQIENIMMIMAGGLGTRLLPHTELCPKPMLELGGRPMLEHIILKAKADGFYNFIISIHHLGNMIEDYFNDGSKWGVKIKYVREESPLGTAGSLSLVDAPLNSPIVVSNGDVLTDIRYTDIIDFHIAHQASATMAVRSHEIQNQFGVVVTNGIELEGFEEKPVYRSYINAGIYVLEPKVLSLLKFHEYCNMPTLFELIKENLGRTVVFPMHESWLDVGRPGDLIEARKLIR